MPFESLNPDAKKFLRHKAVSVEEIGLQKGTDRFNKNQYQQNYEHIPGIREWRLNLTRLSQVYNLFLVAYLDKLYVYEPSHPNQELPERPSLILSPPRTTFAQYGYLDQECPHSINHLLVDFFGEQEVALIACDDGDVIGYYVNKIQAGIDRRLDAYSLNTIFGDEIHPFFMHNVRMSAWGLSVHSQARKIAVSSNTHEVTVISFGLVEPGSGDLYHSEDHKFVMTGYNNNLPTVAFCNTEDDPQGRILVSGEITGLIYLHELGTREKNEIMQIGFCLKTSPGNLRCDCTDQSAYPHSIWCVAFIGRHAFRRTAGYAPYKQGKPDFDKYWNGSLMKHCVPNSNSKWLYMIS
ncbi:hypothetical protein, variant 1 [Verruconis gallopava]|uniref:Uncharacterized protein n=1 Tax=Verruconis gallopava TaxID=253628 RepID=A0A0D1YE46_9PEZI|nr:hypothetical protein, variant 1 [Verruconis gallopava]KIV98971.1 hypothetical protein, variant 1 [Verruconis gallopava]